MKCGKKLKGKFDSDFEYDEWERKKEEEKIIEDYWGEDGESDN